MTDGNTVSYWSRKRGERGTITAEGRKKFLKEKGTREEGTVSTPPIGK